MKPLLLKAPRLLKASRLLKAPRKYKKSGGVNSRNNDSTNIPNKILSVDTLHRPTGILKRLKPLPKKLQTQASPKLQQSPKAATAAKGSKSPTTAKGSKSPKTATAAKIKLDYLHQPGEYNTYLEHLGHGIYREYLTPPPPKKYKSFHVEPEDTPAPITSLKIIENVDNIVLLSIFTRYDTAIRHIGTTDFPAYTANLLRTLKVMIDTSIIDAKLKTLKEEYYYSEDKNFSTRDLNFLSVIKENYIDPYLTLIKYGNNMRVDIKPGFRSQQQEIEKEKEKARIALRNKEIKQHEYNQQQLALENYRALQTKIKLEQLENEKNRPSYPPPYYNTTRNNTPYRPIEGRWIPEKSGLGVYEKGHYVWTGTALGR